MVGESYDSRGTGHLFTEADWGEFGPDESRVPYNRSKTLAERRAHEIAGAQQRWTLVTILPGVVQGPPPGMVHASMSVDICRAANIRRFVCERPHALVCQTHEDAA